MTDKRKHQSLTLLIAVVWLINGLFCKVLNWVPRHQEIVARIIGGDYARELTMLIGISEIIMAGWIFSGICPRLNALVQMIIIALMNTLEFILAPDLLLWGRLNALFACLLVFLIYYNEFKLRNQLTQQP